MPAFNMKKNLLSTLSLVLLFLAGMAQTNTWTGTKDNDWHKSCNWSLSQIPSCSHDVVIPATSNNPHVTGIAHSRTIQVQSTNGAQLFVETSNGAQLYISSVNGCSGTPTNNSSCCGGSALLQYTAGVQTWQVPACVTSITYDVRGAQGGTSYPAITRGGYGGRVTGTLAVTPNETLYFYVGGAGGNAGSCNGGAGGYNGGANGAVYCGSYAGGGGGGASDIRRGGTGLGNRVVVAGGGGGGAYNYGTADYDRGGNGGGSTGEGGYGGGSVNGDGTGIGGRGGSQSGGGAAGSYSGWCIATAGSLGVGGAAGTCNNSGGGGGGGYYGGGGGVWNGGGGGSNYPSAGTQGFQTGNGAISITW
jgi:hypothetical protein